MGCSAKQEAASLRYDMRYSTEQIIPQIVKIAVQRGGEQRIGTGIIVRLSQDEVYIVTAVDIVGTASRAEVEFFDRRNRPVSATLVGLGTQDSSELALLRVTDRENIPVGLPPLPLQSSARLEKGGDVFAIGFSRLAGPLSAIRGNIVSHEGWHILFDQAIDEGYSGSPVILQGQVVGLITEVVGFYGRVTATASILRLVENRSDIPRVPTGIEGIPGGGIARESVIGFGAAVSAEPTGKGLILSPLPSRLAVLRSFQNHTSIRTYHQFRHASSSCG